MGGRLDKRNSVIIDMYLDGMTQDAIASTVGISQAQVSRILHALLNPNDPKEIERFRASMLAKVQDLIDIHADRAMEERLPPAFSHSGKILHDEYGGIVRDASGSRAETATVLALLNRLSAMLGSDAPSRASVDMSVNYTYEGVDPNDV